MKKIILALSIAAITSTPLLAIAGAPEPGFKTLEQFKKEFPTAEGVSWGNEADYDKASFILSGRRVIAYFNREGDFEGCIRDIFYDQLPLTVMTAVEKKYPDAEVLFIREINNTEGTHYKIRLDSGDKKLVVKIQSDGNISKVNKAK